MILLVGSFLAALMIEVHSSPLNTKNVTIIRQQSSRMIPNVPHKKNELGTRNGPFHQDFLGDSSSKEDDAFEHSGPDQSYYLQQFNNIERKMPKQEQKNLRRRLGSPIELARLFEGDIADVDPSTFFNPTRNAVRNTNQLWPGGVVPYTISGRFSSNEMRRIEEGFKNFRDATCIRFVPRSNQKDYVAITKGSSCSSAVGRRGGQQQLILGSGCFVDRGTVTHELMHAVGFWHEQSRPDRDNYVTIRYDNIQRGMEDQFRKYDLSEVQTLNTQYDIRSVMHYVQTEFSKDGVSPTIVSKTSIPVPRERTGFSNNDIIKINRLYRCQNSNLVRSPSPGVDVDEICEDRHELCSEWAGTDECVVNPSYMLAQCPRSCNQCSPSYPDYDDSIA